VSGNLRLRAAVAYGEVMHLLSYDSIGAFVYSFLEMIARDLREGIHTGRGPSLNTLNNLYVAHEEFRWRGPLEDVLCRAIRVISDNENASLDELPDERLHLAHVVKLAVLAAQASSDSRDGPPGSEGVIAGLAACVSLGGARHYLDQLMISMSPADEFSRRLGLARGYLQECFSNPNLKPNRFPVESPWKDAIDNFFG
jgi:hypothetical protein